MMRIFSIGDGACLIFWTVSLIVARILVMLRDLKISEISFRELMMLSCWAGVSFGSWSLGGPQGLLSVGGGVGLLGRAGKFSLLTVGGVGLGVVVAVAGALDI